MIIFNITYYETNYYMEDNILSMLIGHFLGDALGTPFESIGRKKTSTEEYRGSLKDVRLERVGMYGRKTILDYGQVSDDSEMTMVVFRNVMKILNIVEHGYKRDDKTKVIEHKNTTKDICAIYKQNILHDYMKWANSDNNFSMGKNTRSLFKGVKTIKGYETRFNKLYFTETNRDHKVMVL